MQLGTGISRVDNYSTAVNWHDPVTLNSEWEKYTIVYTASYTGKALISLTYGSMPDGTIMHIDGMQLIASEASLNTDEISGYKDETNKALKIPDVERFEVSDIEVELPYYDDVTKEITTKRFNPTSIDAKAAYIEMYDGTLSGVGRVYINDVLIGEFDYELKPHIDNVYPSFLRVDEDFTIVGGGFVPNTERTWVILKGKNIYGKTYEKWMPYNIIDSELSQVTLSSPYGVMSGSVYVQISYENKNGEIVNLKSKKVKYQVKPSIHSVSWSKRGYEQVGDMLTISGKGIVNSPKVNFYNADDELIDTNTAKLVVVDDYQEVIEVESATKENIYKITVESGGVESDLADALYYEAKPIIEKIKSDYSRTMYASNEKISAAKIGEEITITGEALKSSSDEVVVEFDKGEEVIEVIVAEEDISSKGTSLKVTVPEGTQSGYLKVKVAGVASNYLVLEIIPTITQVYPETVIPGETMTILAKGVGNEVDQAKVFFNNGKTEFEVVPNSLSYDGYTGVIEVTAPNGIASNNNSVRLQYGNWSDDGDYSLTVNPYVYRASIDLDTKILSIKGSGFSVSAKENIITYKYADEEKTLITPDVKMIGVYNTEEGQEIKIKINDDYHYGWVSVQVGDKTSNEANFGPVKIHNIARRVEYVEKYNRDMGVLYITGNNMGDNGGVQVGEVWADLHYRSSFFIIAVVEPDNVDGWVTVTKEE
jgi:hypothetical protein